MRGDLKGSHKTSIAILFVTNIQSLSSKMEELELTMTAWKEVEDCCVLRYGSTQRSQISEEAVQLTGHTTYQATRASDSGKARGRGLCVYTNNRRCTHTKITNTQCSPDLKYLTVMCRPFYLPGELRGNDYYCLHPPFKLTWL